MYNQDNLAIRVSSSQDLPSAEFLHHSSAQRVNTDVIIFQAIRSQYPGKQVIICPERNCNLIQYAARGLASAVPIDDAKEPSLTSLKWRLYVPPSRRLDGDSGQIIDGLHFGKFLYSWNGHEFILYFVDGRDGQEAYPTTRHNYIVGDENAINQLINTVGKFTNELHNEIWVFEQSMWRKDADLWRSVHKASWDDVILDADMKKAIITDARRFFDSRSTYAQLRVPWKRGLIYYGPPGNGKTISIKAMMHDLYNRKPAVPTLYVKTLSGYLPPAMALAEIFSKARQEAPCFLVFEDLDSIVSDSVRSFFLNEVDGLSSNDGILMVGSTNHLERLDPGISKRPSRFDRKYLFPNPNEAERVKYCEYWQRKLSDNKDIDFPHVLCKAIAKITDDFSFAYIQEAFVAALLSIAAADGETVTFVEEDELNKYILWREIKKQVKILRDDLDKSGN
ncbi:P-loop containing nucleoside triphosphate hydrolase protein [Xylona heveae TC161]|uniref:p-loop containing nucleoside triphosphate hydrolase protein n=1 Tax=Xylona heveae (strain CBS 132557 / TC161) TaxID=1328760 RepID=A0A165AC18_XYLHT|nr:P-loop containing nucleoside triphosphate hydrolase protein [Xylona heveae TC161]KZF20234.1 P-loop containing nucleoside triphosphate hydrolase protein [Xylona heveae TC161]